MVSVAENLSKSELTIELEDEVDRKYRLFEQFDAIRDHSDHYFAKSEAKQPTKAWTEWLQREWKILQNNLPENIYVRTYENRMDIMRVVIVGPAGTPYHDGLFFFDIFFPHDYPHKPPKVYYWSHGFRLNPNLYESGRVCLSLLDTWYGKGCEKWIPRQSTTLQIVVSIQSLVLNSSPYFNEPVLSWPAPFTTVLSQQYNENSFLLSCQSMLCTLKRPPKHFEDFVVGHFRKHGHNILLACIAYMNGAQIGSKITHRCLKSKVAEGGRRCSPSFRIALKNLSEKLVSEFGIQCAECAESLDLLVVKPGFFSRRSNILKKLVFGFAVCIIGLPLFLSFC